MRTRVMASLDDPLSARRHPRLLSMTAAAMTTVIAAAVVVLAWQSRPRPVDNPAIAQATPASPNAIAVADTLAAAPVRKPVNAEALRSVRGVSRLVATPTTEEVAWEARAVAPLAVPDALAIGGAQPAATVPPLLDITPLVTEPLAVTPLEEIDSVSAGGA